MCNIYLQLYDLAKGHLVELYKELPTAYADLYHEVADAYIKKKLFKDALFVLDRMEDVFFI